MLHSSKHSREDDLTILVNESGFKSLSDAGICIVTIDKDSHPQTNHAAASSSTTISDPPLKDEDATPKPK